MKEHNLFRAIGNAQDAFLLEIDRPQVRRLPRRFGLIAAVLALAILTACAAPVIWEAVSIENAQVINAGEHQTYIYHYNSGETEPFSQTPLQQIRYEVEMNIEVSGELPSTIETAYLPAYIPRGWAPVEQMIIDYHHNTGASSKLYSSWDRRSEDGSNVHVMIYEQKPLDFYDPEDPVVDWFYTLTSAQLESQIIRLGEMDVLEISYPDCGEALLEDWTEHKVVTLYPWPGIRNYYWSDGVYLFKLHVSYDTDISTVEDVISSISVTDVNEIPVIK